MNQLSHVAFWDTLIRATDIVELRRARAWKFPYAEIGEVET
jgi:hypothetical protein